MPLLLIGLSCSEGRADLIGERDALMALAYAMGGHSTSGICFWE